MVVYYVVAPFPHSLWTSPGPPVHVCGVLGYGDCYLYIYTACPGTVTVFNLPIINSIRSPATSCLSLTSPLRPHQFWPLQQLSLSLCDVWTWNHGIISPALHCQAGHHGVALLARVRQIFTEQQARHCGVLCCLQRP